MTREEAKELLPIMQAFADGKTIELCCDSGATWVTDYDPSFKPGLCYRIKSESKYRPFKNQEECWEEMLKHQPFGWLVNKNNKSIYHINVICCDDLCLDETPLNFVEAFTYYEFLDGSHFGIKEEQQ